MKNLLKDKFPSILYFFLMLLYGIFLAFLAFSPYLCNIFGKSHQSCTVAMLLSVLVLLSGIVLTGITIGDKIPRVVFYPYSAICLLLILFTYSPIGILVYSTMALVTFVVGFISYIITTVIPFS